MITSASPTFFAFELVDPGTGQTLIVEVTGSDLVYGPGILPFDVPVAGTVTSITRTFTAVPPQTEPGVVSYTGMSLSVSDLDAFNEFWLLPRSPADRKTCNNWVRASS